MYKNHYSRDANLWRSKIWRVFCYNTAASNYPLPPQEEGDETSSPSNRPPYPQIDLELPMFALTLQWEKRKIFTVFRGLKIDPKLNGRFSDVGPEN